MFEAVGLTVTCVAIVLMFHLGVLLLMTSGWSSRGDHPADQTVSAWLGGVGYLLVLAASICLLAFITR